MEAILSVLTILYTDIYFYHEMFVGVVKRLVRLILLLASFLIVPFTRIRFCRKRGQCPPITNKLLLLSATELARKIRKREIRSEDVISAYVERCREVNPMINAIVESRFDDALREAREADLSLKLNNRTEEELARDTPFFGVPITVKESICVKGMSHSVGMKRNQPRKASEDADVVKRVRKAGAIPILVSNTPELCMCWETYNKVTGTTWNPYDTRRTPGGSSGGEGALVGSAASVISLSSDIGGSARLPAMFCGIFGHKPTPGWVSSLGHLPDCDANNWASFFSIGPMVRYAEDLPVLLKTMCHLPEASERLERKVSIKDLKYFYMEDDGGNGATSSVDTEIKSSISRLVNHLKDTHGLKVSKANVEGMKYSFEIATTLLLSINGADCIFSKPDNPHEWKSVFVECLKYICMMSPHIFSSIFYGILKKFNDNLPESHHRKMLKKNSNLKKEFEELLGDNGVFIYPTFVSTAHYPYEIYHKVANVSYMMIFNSLGLPVTQCPMGFGRNGLPLGLQIVANPGNDHLTIAVAQEIEKAFGGWKPPPSSEKIV